MNKLCSSANYLEANTIRAMLDSEGIEVFLKGEALAGAMGELPMNVTEIEVFVKPEQFAQAERLLNDFKQRQVHGNNWLCGECGEENAPAFEICWSCQNSQ